MKWVFAVVIAAAALFLSIGFLGQATPPPQAAYRLQEGDIVFHGNAGGQNDAIREATGSPYTHCGVVFEKDGKLMVFEAVQPVRATTVEAFISRSLPNTFHARRLKTPLKPEVITTARTWTAKQMGRNYDHLFQWSDGALYCSELVWKAYDKAGIQLCPTRHFQDYNLESPAVQAVITRRYGSADKLPRKEPVVAPGDLAASPRLVEVPRANRR